MYPLAGDMPPAWCNEPTARNQRVCEEHAEECPDKDRYQDLPKAGLTMADECRDHGNCPHEDPDRHHHFFHGETAPL